MARKIAVLVGCNYPGTKAELRGCVNDVWRMHRSLIERFGFQARDITVMIDTDQRYVQPTGANIKRTLNNLLAHSHPGDVIFFHFSGHGTRLPPETGAPDDTGYDECIVPCDMNLMTDDDFREIVDRVPHGVTLTLVSDSCHSGGLIKHEKEQIGESYTQHGGNSAQGGSRDFGLRDFVTQSIQGALEDRGIHLPSFGHGHGHSHSYGLQQHPFHHVVSQHRRRYLDEDEHYHRVPYAGVGHVKSRALPLSMLLEILKQKTGRQDIDVGTIRPALFDLFGQDSSSKVKKFVKVMLQAMEEGGEGGSQGGGFVGALGSIAQQFLKQKLNQAGNSQEYLQPALETNVPAHQAAYAGATLGSVRDRGILVSGCQSSETSADANPTGNPHEAYGAMSNAIQTILSQHYGPITNHELVSRARQLLSSQGFSQHPGLYCSDENTTSIFIC